MSKIEFLIFTYSIQYITDTDIQYWKLMKLSSFGGSADPMSLALPHTKFLNPQLELG